MTRALAMAGACVLALIGGRYGMAGNGGAVLATLALWRLLDRTP